MFVFPSTKQSPRTGPADISALRSHNTGLILHELWREEQLSRAQLSRQTGLSRSTVSAIINDLESRALVLESHLARSSGGRPPIVLRFAAERFQLVGVEMGSSHISTVVTDLKGRALAERHRRHDVQGNPYGAIKLIQELIELSIADADATSIVGVGVAVPCPIDPSRPDELSTRILPRWEGINLAERLHEHFQFPIFIDNDANLGALAERWWGAGRDCDDFSYIKIATGVGAGHIIAGDIYRGASGIAGEIGHTAIDANGPRCRCGLNGCLESMIGSSALIYRARERLRGGAPSVLQDSPTLDLSTLLAAAGDGDVLARGLIVETGRYLGVAVANLLNLLNPAKVVLGGALTEAGMMLLEPMRQTIRERALWTAITEAEVVRSELGDAAIALGGATLVLQAALDAPDLFPTPGAEAPSPQLRT